MRQTLRENTKPRFLPGLIHRFTQLHTLYHHPICSAASLVPLDNQEEIQNTGDMAFLLRKDEVVG